MSQIYAAIFEWDHADVELLKKAKVSEWQIAGIKIPSTETVLKAISKQELTRHCRRKIRSVTDTTSTLEKVFSSLLNATDTLGVPLLKEDVMAVLNTESRHVPCLQEPTGVLLYTKIDTIKKATFLFPCTGAAGERHPWKAFIVTLRISYHEGIYFCLGNL
jgi:hypothetical protein